MLYKSKSQAIYNNIKRNTKINEINDFYSVVINAINQNNDNIVNKQECIEKILQIKSSRRNENRKNKININSLLNKERTKIKNKLLQFSNYENKKEEMNNNNNSDIKILNQNNSQPELLSEVQKKESKK
jgi:hypothetical protein